MNLADFSTFVMNEFDLYSGDFGMKHEAKTCGITKDNGEHTIALVCDGYKGEVMPYLDLSPYHKRYSSDVSYRLENIIKDIVKDYIRYLSPSEHDSNILGYQFDFERQKDYVIPQIDNYAANAEWIDKLPHKVIDDMAVTYHICINPYEEETSERITFPITDQILNKWYMNVDDIHTIAVSNIPRLLPLSYLELSEVLSDIYIPSICESKNVSEKEAERIVKDEVLPDIYPGLKSGDMFLVSSLASDYGSANFLYDEYKNSISGLVGGEYYVLPSSPHELIVIPDRGQDPQMVTDVMQNVFQSLLPSDIHSLSENIYYFDDSHQLSVFATVTAENDLKSVEISDSVIEAARVSDPSLGINPVIIEEYNRPISRFR